MRGLRNHNQGEVKMDKKTATEFVERIEAHRDQERAIWQEMREHPDYQMHEDKAIKGIIDAREKAHGLIEEADAGLGAFDWIDDGTGNFVPREEVDA
jgi:Zn-dependent M32 family carboxypeptidase